MQYVPINRKTGIKIPYKTQNQRKETGKKANFGMPLRFPVAEG